MKYLVMICRGHVPVVGRGDKGAPINKDIKPFLLYFLPKGSSNRIFSGCNKTSVVVDADSGKIVACIKNGTRVDALGCDPSKKQIVIPNGGEGNVTVVHQDSPDKYTEVATVATFAGAKTVAVDPKTHYAYLFQPERGPAPPAAPDAPPPAVHSH